MSQLWNDVLVAVKRKRPSGKHTMDKRHCSETQPTDADYGLKIVATQDAIVAARSGADNSKIALDGRSTSPGREVFDNSDDYDRQRAEVVRRERVLGFEHACTKSASKEEIRANEILQRLREYDNERVYKKADLRTGHGGQRHPRVPGDHFLSNVELIRETEVFKVARHMPKGAHLHIHFNSCLQPKVLLEVARSMERMFIKSNMPLVPDDDYVNYERCEIQFSIVKEGEEKPGNLFDRNYTEWQTMQIGEFLKAFPEKHPYATGGFEWLERKLQFSEDDAHSKLQTSYGAWEKFNGRTRMMKGLFNYESAYRTYTQALLQDFEDDNIQYAEIRPNFMKSNQLTTDNGEDGIDNFGIMDIIIEEYRKFQKKPGGRSFAGLKVIYCTPRSFSNELVKYALDECIKFKTRWPEWIAGTLLPPLSPK